MVGFLPAGHRMISINKAFKSTTVDIEEGTACEHRLVDVNITLKQKPKVFPCPKANISVLVQDKLVATTLPGARVVIKYQVRKERMFRIFHKSFLTDLSREKNCMTMWPIMRVR